MPINLSEVVNNRYRVDALIGQGGMGAVYLAWDLILQIPVALKENLDTSEPAKKQFTEEALILARLNYPGLPRVLDYFSLPGQGEYLVMDFIEGRDLEDILNDNAAVNQSIAVAVKGLDEAQVIPWVLEVLDTLDYLHQQKPAVVHRDIKPANIKVTSDGRVILVDFGIAKRYSIAQSTLTGAHAVSPGYSPPEQYGTSTTDPRSDLYALGATLYHLLTGQKPTESVHRMTGSVKMLSPRLLNPSISEDLERVIIKAMAIPMDNRYQDAVQMRSALSTSLNFVTSPAPEMNRLGQPSQHHQSIPMTSQSLAAQSAATHNTSSSSVPPGLSTKHSPVSGSISSYAPAKSARKRLTSQLPLILLITIVTITSGMILIRRLLQSNKSQAGALNGSPISTVVSPPERQLPSSTPPSRILTPLATASLQNIEQATTPTIPPYPVYIYDLFQFPRINWQLESGTNLTCKRERGIYVCNLPAQSANNYWLRPEGIDLQPGFVLSAEIEFPKDNPSATAGLIFRDSPEGRYLFSINRNGQYRLSSIQESPANWMNLIEWTANEAIQSDKPNLLQVAADGSSYSLFVNNQYLASLDDSSWIKGGPGIYLFAVTDIKPATFRLNNFEIRQK